MAKTENKTSMNQSKNEEDAPKKTLSGFDLNEYKAKPIDTGIVLDKQITCIPVKKPNNQQFFRIHPSLEILVDILEWKDEGIFYLVHQSMVPPLFEQTKRVMLHVGIFQSGSPFLFPVPQPNENGAWNSWHKSASKAVTEAKKNWVRIQPDRSIGGYVVISSGGNLSEPKWPDLTIDTYLSIAFSDARIDDEHHEIVKYLKGL